MSDLRRVLGSSGTLVMVGASDGRRVGPFLARLLAMFVASRFSSQKLLPFLATVTNADLVVLKDLIEAGKVRPVIDRTYPLSATAEAIRYLEEGHARGKVVITM